MRTLFIKILANLERVKNAAILGSFGIRRYRHANFNRLLATK